MGVPTTVTGFSYLWRRTGSSNGTVKDYAFHLSDDGQTWANRLWLVRLRICIKAATWPS